MPNHSAQRMSGQAQISPCKVHAMVLLSRRTTLPRRIGPWPIKRARSDGDKSKEPRGLLFDSLVDDTTEKTSFGTLLKNLDAECAKIDKMVALTRAELAASATSDASEQNTATAARPLENPETLSMRSSTSVNQCSCIGLGININPDKPSREDSDAEDVTSPSEQSPTFDGFDPEQAQINLQP